MSMGLGKEKKSKTKTKDQNEEKPSSPKEAMTSSQLAPAESEVFDSSSDNAMSEMKKVAEMGPEEESKVFSHLEEKQQLDPSAISTSDSVKETNPKKSLAVLLWQSRPYRKENMTQSNQ